MAGYRPNDNKRSNMFLNCDLDEWVLKARLF